MFNQFSWILVVFFLYLLGSETKYNTDHIIIAMHKNWKVICEMQHDAYLTKASWINSLWEFVFTVIILFVNSFMLKKTTCWIFFINIRFLSLFYMTMLYLH